jgi:hypothetical protein
MSRVDAGARQGSIGRGRDRLKVAPKARLEHFCGAENLKYQWNQWLTGCPAGPTRRMLQFLTLNSLKTFDR